VDDELKRLIEGSASETRRHFDVIAERLEQKVEVVAEGVVTANQRIERFEAAMKEEFADVRSMIKFSHAELDRRVRTLEESHRNLEQSVADLQARMERLESTH
jgi:chaperonin cofactor prefoldin